MSSLKTFLSSHFMLQSMSPNQCMFLELNKVLFVFPGHAEIDQPLA